METLQPTPYETAVVYREGGRYCDAIGCLQNWLVHHPQDAQAFALLAHVLLLNKQDETASAAIACARAIAPALSIVQRNYARVLLKQQKVEIALEAAHAAHQAEPQNEENWLILAAALSANQREAEALALIESAIKVRPDYAEAHATRALHKLRCNDLAGALADTEKALAVKPHLAQVWRLAATLNYRGKNLSGAIDALRRTVGLDPDEIQDKINLGELLRQNKETEAAIVVLQEAVAFAPDNAGAWATLAMTLQNAGRIEEAISAYNRALGINPLSAEIACNLGALTMSVGNWEQGVRYFEQALAIKPDFPEALLNLGTALKDQGKPGEAIVRYEQALAIKPDYAEARICLGLALMDHGKLAAAISEAKVASQYNVSTHFAHYQLGVLLARSGFREEAQVQFELYMKRDPEDFQGARMVLAKLGFEPIPKRAPDALLNRLYSARAVGWNQGEITRTYRGADLVSGALERLLGVSENLNILDAGCGTGLVGIRVRHRARRLEGVDLSAAMLEKAKEKGIYNQLYQGDLVAFLSSHSDRYDVVTCAATLIHFSDLSPVFEAAAKAIRAGGLFIFTLFPNDDDNEVAVGSLDGFAQGGCYFHGRTYVTRLAEASKFRVEILDTAVHEYHRGQPRMGLVVALRRKLPPPARDGVAVQ
jgi:predicted TPR repeat methyltransferase